MRFLSLTCVVCAVIAIASANLNIKLEFDPEANISYSYLWRFVDTSVVNIEQQGIPADCKAYNDECKLPGSVYMWRSRSHLHPHPQAYYGDTAIVAAFHPTKDTAPFAMLAYAAGDNSTAKDPAALLKDIVNGQDDSSFNGSMVLAGAFTLEEVDEHGRSVSNTIVPLTAAYCEPTKIKGENIDGLFCEYLANNAGNTNMCRITITYVATTLSGILTYGRTPMCNHAMSMIIEVENFQLTKKSNHVRLALGFATSFGDRFNVKEYTKYATKSKEFIYASASTHAIVNGEFADVSVAMNSGYVDPQLRKTFDIVAERALGKDFFFGDVTVDFPEGAGSFVYDPALGIGDSVYEAAASTVSLSLLAVLVCTVLFYLFF